MAETFNFSQFDNKYLTEQEKAEINGYRKMAQDGVITWKDANTFAEQIRAKYGYSGGTDGAGYTPLPKSGTETTIPALLQHQSKMGSTDFDEYLKTARAKGLKERYEQAGKLAMQDTVGDIAARTGGLASSYAGVAGQQVYGQYMQGLEDAQQENFDKELARAQQKEQTAYQRLLNQMTMDENKAKTLAAYGDFSGYKALGYTDEQIAKMEATYQASLVKDNGETVYSDDVVAVAAELDTTEARAQALKNLGSKQWVDALAKLGTRFGPDGESYGSDYDTYERDVKIMLARGNSQEQILEHLSTANPAGLTEAGMKQLLAMLA